MIVPYEFIFDKGYCMKKCLLGTIILCVVSFSSAWAADPAPTASSQAGASSSADIQKTLTQLQKQIQAVSDSLPVKLKAVTDNNQKSQKVMQSQIQTQLDHMQSQIQQSQDALQKKIQAQLDHIQSEINEIEQDNAKQLSALQKEVQELSKGA